MKNIKKLLALVLALAICAAFALPALAADDETPDSGDTPNTPTTGTTYKLTMNNAQPGHTYVLYQVLKGTVLPGSDNIPTGTLGNVQWGDNYTGSGDAADYAKTLAGLTAPGALNDEIEKIKANFTESSFTTPAINDAGAIVWEGLPGGYYVVVDETEGALDPTDPLSKVMAQVVGDTTITPKPDKLIPDKDVKEALDPETEYQKIINSEVGRILDYKVTATVSVGTMNLNANYWVALSDTMTKGHTYDTTSAELVVLNPDGNKIEGLTLPKVKSVVNEDGSTTLTVDKFDLKKALNDANAMPEIGNVIVQLKYKATVNADAIQFEVVENEVKWSTDTSNDGSHMQEGTPIKTKTYIYKLSGEKISGDDKSALPGAEFTLERIVKNADGTVDESKTETVEIYATATPGEYYAWNNGESTLPSGATTHVEGNVIVANGGDKQNTFVVDGLAEGWYRLTETKTPDGYNTMAALEIQIVPNEIDEKTALETPGGNGCTYNYDEVVKSNVVKVENNKGSQLPSTGGIGTTIFYVVGAVLVVGAGVLLFTKRRIKG